MQDSTLSNDKVGPRFTCSFSQFAFYPLYIEAKAKFPSVFLLTKEEQMIHDPTAPQ